MTTPMLEVDGLAVNYGRAIRALSGVSLVVPYGTAVALLGPNGAGKTTLLRSVTGGLKLHRGTVVGGDIRFEGESILGRSSVDLVKAGVSQVLEGRRIFRHLTVEQNLQTGAATVRDRATARRNVESVMERIPFLAERRGTPGGLLSGGEQQLLAIGRALTSNPRLLVLDEPSLGLAPLVIQRIGELIASLIESGLTVLLVEQNADMALTLASYGYVLTQGRTVLEGTPDQLRKDGALAALYLGAAPAASATGAAR